MYWKVKLPMVLGDQQASRKCYVAVVRSSESHKNLENIKEERIKMWSFRGGKERSRKLWNPRKET